MKLRPSQAPDYRVTGARPARLATALAARRPSSGIWVSSPAAVTRDTPGIDVRISVRRASPSSSASRFPCRKRPFATHGRGRLQTRAAVCRIPCLILCLADVAGSPSRTVSRIMHEQVERDQHHPCVREQPGGVRGRLPQNLSI